MSLPVGSTTSRTEGLKVRVHCPRCGPDVAAQSYESVEKMGILFVVLIPLLTQRETYVECCGCGLKRLTRLSLMELDAYSADALERHLYPRVSIIVWMLAIASVVLFCIPYLGLLLGVAGMLASWRTGRWPWRLSLVGAGLSLMISALALYAALS